MRRWAVAGAGVLVVACWARAAGDGHPLAPAAGRSPSAPAAGSGGPPASDRMPGPPPGARDVRVVRVVDGDTLILTVAGRRTRVRLIGIDAPETRPRPACFAQAATRALRWIAPPGSTLRAAADRDPYDRHGRTLLHLWTHGGRFIASELVRAGFARAMPVPPNLRHAAALRAAEGQAERAAQGRWRACRPGRSGTPERRTGRPGPTAEGRNRGDPLSPWRPPGSDDARQ